MSNIRKDLKKFGANPGLATPKNPEAIAALTEDIEVWPTLNADGVTWDGNFVFKAGTSFFKVYMTKDTQKASFENGGSTDAYGAKNKFEGIHPGTPKEAVAFFKNNVGKSFIIFYGGCSTDEYKTMGTKCNPMILKVSGEDSNDGNKNTMTWEQELLNDEYIRFYSGQISFDATLPVLTGAALALNSAQGKVLKLASSATAADITIASSNFKDGDIITLVGSGGAGPLSLKNSATTGVLLKNASTWTALDGASITLEVVVADKPYYKEVSRS